MGDTEADKRRNEILKRMVQTPPTPHRDSKVDNPKEGAWKSRRTKDAKPNQ